MRWMAPCLLLLAACGTAPGDVATAQGTAPLSDAVPLTYKVDDFNRPNFQFNVYADIQGTSLILTDGSQGYIDDQTGTLFPVPPLTPTADHSFSSYFTLRMVTGVGSGSRADGMTFVLQTAGNSAAGIPGGNLGYGGMAPSVAVEMDTFLNGNIGDPDDHHVGTHLNGDMSGHLATASLPAAWVDNQPYGVWVDYDGTTQVLEVRVSDASTTRPGPALLTQTLDFNATLGAGAPYFPGFSAGTANEWGSFFVDAWYYQNHYAPIDVEANSYVQGPASVSLESQSTDGGHSFTVTATVRDAEDSLHVGWPVTFTTSAGTLSQQTATTDGNGNASVTVLGADTAVTASVVATALDPVAASTQLSLLANPSIQAVAGAHGSIQPQGTVFVPYGQSQMFELQPDAHYQVQDVLVDGTSRGPLASLTLDAVVSAHTVEARFVASPTDREGYGVGFNCAASPSAALAGWTLPLLLGWLGVRSKRRAAAGSVR